MPDQTQYGQAPITDEPAKPTGSKSSIDHKTIVDWYTDFHKQTSPHRILWERDADYYDGDQWTQEERDALNDRNQPEVTINVVAPKINAVAGSEVRGRRDPKAIPRTPDHGTDAESITDALRYIADKEDFDQVKSRVAEDFFKIGFAGCLTEVDVDDDKSIKIMHVPWDRLWWDPSSRAFDSADAKYLGIVTTWDLDAARNEPKYEGAREILDKTMDVNEDEFIDMDSNDAVVWSNISRKKIKILECYYKEGGVWYVCHIARGGFLIEPRPVELKDDKKKPRTQCPLTMVSCYVAREGYQRYGLQRGMISPQDEINHRRSKALHVINVRQFKYSGVTQDVGELRDTINQPDGGVQIEPGEDFELLPTGDMAASQFQLLQQAYAEVDLVGPSIGLQGPTNADVSGRSILAQQQAASLGLEGVFDRLSSWERTVFRHIWFWVRVMWTEHKWMTVTDDESRNGYRFVELNKKMTKGERVQDLIEEGTSLPDALKVVGIDKQKIAQGERAVEQAASQGGPEAGQQALQAIMQQLQPELAEPMTMNDVSRIDVDILITHGQDVPTVQQEELQELARLMPSLPGIPDVQRAKIVVEAMTIRAKDKILKLLDGENDPAAAQAAAQQQQIAQQTAALQMGKLQSEATENNANAEDHIASAEKKKAEAARIHADTGEKMGKLAAEAGGFIPAGE